MVAGALPNHLATPPWLEQAPCCDSALDHVLSAQRAVAFFGIRSSFFSFGGFTAAVFCALSVAGAASAATTSRTRIDSVRRILVSGGVTRKDPRYAFPATCREVEGC